MRAQRRILALLAVASRPLSGLEIAQITRTWSGSLYTALGRLEDDRMIIGEWGTREPGDTRPRQRFYRLSESAIV